MFYVLFNSEIVREDEIPQNMRQQAEDCYQELIEHVSNVDEQLGEIFLEERQPNVKELKGMFSLFLQKIIALISWFCF